jgi:hypothetical protein
MSEIKQREMMISSFSAVRVTYQVLGRMATRCPRVISSSPRKTGKVTLDRMLRGHILSRARRNSYNGACFYVVGIITPYLNGGRFNSVSTVSLLMFTDIRLQPTEYTFSLAPEESAIAI